MMAILVMTLQIGLPAPPTCLQAYHIKNDHRTYFGVSKKGNQLKENHADGKKPGRKGLAKRMGVDCKQPISKLRKVAKNSTGEKRTMAHWCANMKSGKKKANKR